MPARFRAFFVAGTGPVPITAGSTPTTAVAIISHQWLQSQLLGFLFHIISSAAVPSFSGELLPAVTVPIPGMNAGLSAARLSMLAIGPHALVDLDEHAIALLRRGHRSATISGWNSPLACAAAASLMAAQSELVLLLA